MIENNVKTPEPVRILFVKGWRPKGLMRAIIDSSQETVARAEEYKRNSRKKDMYDDDTSLRGVAASAGNHCCECVNVMTLYLKEIFKLICCITSPNIELEAQGDNKFGNMFCDLVDITFGFFKDLLNLLRLLILCSTDRKNF